MTEGKQAADLVLHTRPLRVQVDQGEKPVVLGNLEEESYRQKSSN